MKKDHVFIIGEAGVNHNGRLSLAYELIDRAKEAGVDGVKFQTFIPEKLVSKFADRAKYQKGESLEFQSQLSMIRKLSLSFDDFRALNDYCKGLGIMFLSSPFDIESIKFLNSIDMKIFKIPSGEITNLPYLIEVSKTNREIILSTGMSTLEEVEIAVNIIRKYNNNKLSLMHCNTQYPTKVEDVNLRAMITLKEKFNVEVGYSDHTMGIEVPIAAVGMGAKIIEKHFTLDKAMEGPDHKASLSPNELKEMVEKIRNIELALGSGEKKPSFSERENINVGRKSIVAKKQIKKGEKFSIDNLTVKRPGGGISPLKWFEVLGRVSDRDYKEDEQIEEV
ncbi:MAG: N-acetylneuraminate synthase [Clostridium sp.]